MWQIKQCTATISQKSKSHELCVQEPDFVRFEICKVHSTLVPFFSVALLCIGCFTLRYVVISRVIKVRNELFHFPLITKMYTV